MTPEERALACCKSALRNFELVRKSDLDDAVGAISQAIRSAEQEARKAALEEAAAVMDAMAGEYRFRDRSPSAITYQAMDGAKRIRALMEDKT